MDGATTMEMPLDVVANRRTCYDRKRRLGLADPG